MNAIAILTRLAAHEITQEEANALLTPRKHVKKAGAVRGRPVGARSGRRSESLAAYVREYQQLVDEATGPSEQLTLAMGRIADALRCSKGKAHKAVHAKQAVVDDPDEFTVRMADGRKGVRIKQVVPPAYVAQGHAAWLAERQAVSALDEPLYATV